MAGEKDSLENYSPQQQAMLARSMDALLKHPEVSRDTKRLLKTVDPKLNFPELEIEDRIAKSSEASQERIKKLEDELAAERSNRGYERIRDQVTAKGFKMEEVEKAMTERKIGDYDTAMRFLEMERSLAPPTPESLTPFTMPEETKDIMKNPKQWAYRQGIAAVNELLKQRRA